MTHSGARLTSRVRALVIPADETETRCTNFARCYFGSRHKVTSIRLQCVAHDRRLKSSRGPLEVDRTAISTQQFKRRKRRGREPSGLPDARQLFSLPRIQEMRAATILATFSSNSARRSLLCTPPPIIFMIRSVSTVYPPTPQLPSGISTITECILSK